MTEIIITCFIVGLALVMTIRWLRKKLGGEANSCCSSESSSKSFCGCHPDSGEGITNKKNCSIDCSLPRKGE